VPAAPTVHCGGTAALPRAKPPGSASNLGGSRSCCARIISSSDCVPTKGGRAKTALVVELPDELVALLGSPEAAATRAKEALVLDLLREGQLGQSRAAELLGLTRWDILDLMARHQIPSGPETADEMAREIDAVRRFVESAE
jgi:hypothetical protein